ncbi:MAG: ABC transporter ATP-binding protein [Clostridiales bacterium]|nr:ABC transporter ATP-binding protein [Clostridiales bacterium]
MDQKKSGRQPDIPSYLTPLFELHGVDTNSIMFFTNTDLTLSRVRSDTYVAVTEDKIYVLSGSVVLRGDEKSPVFMWKKAKERFEELEFEKFDRNDYSDFLYEEQVSGGVLIGIDGSGSARLLICSTNTQKENLTLLAEYLGGGRAHRHGEHEPHRGDGAGHGGRMSPPHDGDGKVSPKGPLYCPKCGKKYADPHRKTCLHCMDKGKVFRRVLTFVMKYKVQVISLVTCLILSSALGIFAPYISSGFYYDQVLNRAGRFYGQLIFVLSLIVGTKILSMIVTIINSLVTARMGAKIWYDLRKVIFESIERLSLKFFTDKQTGSLMTQVSRDSDIMFWLFANGIPYYLVSITQVIAIAVIMFIMSPKLALLYFITVPVIFIIMKRLFSSMGKYHGKRYTGARKLNSVLSDTISGMRVVKAFSKEQEGSDRFKVVNDASARAGKEATFYSERKFPIVDILMVVGQLTVMGVGGWMVVSGEITYGMLITFTAYIAMIYSPMSQFVRMSYQATDAINAMGRLVEIMDANPDVEEPENPVPKDRLCGDIEIDHVDFGYDKSRMILKDISFTVPHGTILGIVGHTGAGKSTIANLILRMYDVDRGEIRLDGEPIRELPIKALRDSIAIVSQETYLFVGTILENIRYARADATLDEVLMAAKISGAHDFIMKLPDAYSTLIGFGGQQLSGGEKQRLSIARAILRDPSILILDEATAAMDTQTERKIQSALEILVRGKTTIMIAHRLSTLRNADKLIVLKDGEVCESGTHDELIRAKGEYFKLYSLQLAALKNVGVEA